MSSSSLQPRKPSISVVIPCFNAERFVAAAIASVLAQNWPDLEILVIDDGSSDLSAERVRHAFPEVKLVRQSNQGVAAARNNGIRQAQGDWIAFLDADDIWLPGKLQAQWDILNATPGTRMSYSAWHVWTSSESEPPPEYLAVLLSQASDSARWSGASGWVYPQLLLDCVVWTSTVLAHRSVFSEIGLFDPSLRIGEDWELWLRASRVTQILRVPRPYALYRMHPASLTKSAPDENGRSVVVGRALARWGYCSPDGGCARKADVDRALARGWSQFASAHVMAGNFARARRASLTALRSNFWQAHAWTMLIKSVAGSLFGGGILERRRVARAIDALKPWGSKE
jgi:glycosyltransferase involved in cell wall biosynthesis